MAKFIGWQAVITSSVIIQLHYSIKKLVKNKLYNLVL